MTEHEQYVGAARAKLVPALAKKSVTSLQATIDLIDYLRFTRAAFGTFDFVKVNGRAVDSTEYIKDTTRPYFDSWVITELVVALGLPRYSVGTFEELRALCSDAMKPENRKAARRR